VPAAELSFDVGKDLRQVLSDWQRVIHCDRRIGDSINNGFIINKGNAQ